MEFVLISFPSDLTSALQTGNTLVLVYWGLPCTDVVLDALKTWSSENKILSVLKDNMWPVSLTLSIVSKIQCGYRSTNIIMHHTALPKMGHQKHTANILAAATIFTPSVAPLKACDHSDKTHQRWCKGACQLMIVHAAQTATVSLRILNVGLEDPETVNQRA